MSLFFEWWKRLTREIKNRRSWPRWEGHLSRWNNGLARTRLGWARCLGSYRWTPIARVCGWGDWGQELSDGQTNGLKTMANERGLSFKLCFGRNPTVDFMIAGPGAWVKQATSETGVMRSWFMQRLYMRCLTLWSVQDIQSHTGNLDNSA